MNQKNFTKTQEVIKFLESGYIPCLFEIIKGGKFSFNIPNLYMDNYTAVQVVADKGVQECIKLYDYYNKVIKNYIIDCKKKLIEEDESNLIDGFLLHTKNIKFFIYWMYKVFCFLDRFYTRCKEKATLGKSAMDLYKTLFYEEFKSKIQDKIQNMKNEGKNANKDTSEKIQNVMEILEELNLEKPKIIKGPDNIIKWVAE